MTDSDLRLLLAVAVAAAGMMAIAWIYACYRCPATRVSVTVAAERSEEAQRRKAS